MPTTKWIPTLLLCSLIGLLFLTGCSSEEESAKPSDNGFVVVDDENDRANQITLPVNSSSDSTTEQNGEPPEAQAEPETPSQPESQPQPNLPPQQSNIPKTVLEAVANSLEEPVPTAESSIETLQQFISILNNEPRKARNQQEQNQLFAIIAPEVDKLCDMMLSKEELSQTVKLYAYNTKYTALSQMVQIGDKKALARLGQMTAVMSTEEDEFVARKGRLLGLETATHKRLLDAQGSGDATAAIAAISKDVEAWIEGNLDDQEVFAVLQGIGLMLVQINPEQGNELMQTIANGFKDSQIALIALEAKATLEQPAIDESEVYPKSNNYFNAPNSEENKTAFLEAVDKVLANPERGVGTIRTLIDIVQRIEGSETAFLVLDKTAAAYKDLEDEDLASQVASQLDNLIGQILVRDIELIDKFRAVLVDTNAEKKADVLAAYTELFSHERMNATILLSLIPIVDQVADADKNLITQMVDITMPVATEMLDEEQLKIVTDALTKTLNRVNLPDSTMALPSKTLGGEKFDWGSLQGNYVVIDFWATWCGPCLEAIPHIEELQAKYAGKNLKFIGYSIDADRGHLKNFLATRVENGMGLKWPIIIDDIEVDPAVLEENEAVDASWRMPSTVYCGISGIPTMIILDPEGKVLKTIQGAQTLEAELESLFPEEKETPAESPTPEPTEDSHLIAPPMFQFAATTILETLPGQVDEPTSKLLKGNPYSAPAGLDKLELVDYLFDMQDKVKTIRRRPGFAEAVLEASNRLLAMEDASDKFHVIAAETACSILHEQAGLGNEELDNQLVALVDSLTDDPREQIKALVMFHQVERRILDIDELEWEDVVSILDDTHDYLGMQELKEKHLRMAVAVIHTINRSEDFEIRAEQYQRFGELFAGSSFKRLAKYGKSIVKAASQTPEASELVGKEVEIAGLTDLGQPIDWDSYRGKVVLIDFWATWCGPCLAEIPNIKKIHQEIDRELFDVVAINLDSEDGALAAFLKDNPLPWTNVIGEDAEKIADSCGIAALPTMMVVGADGKILAVDHRVAALRSTIKKALEALPQKN